MDHRIKEPALGAGHPTCSRDSMTLQRISIGFLGAYPLVMALSIYANWLTAWLALGHRPRPALDDPLFISTAASLTHIAALLLIWAAPLAFGGCVLGIIFAIRQRDRDREGDVRVWAIAALGSWLLTFVVLRADPGGVLNWFLD